MSSVWNKHLEILLHCWVIWKVTDLPSPPAPPPILAPQSGDSFWRFGGPIWRLPMWEAPNLDANRGGGGCGLGCPLTGFPPNTRNIGFCLFFLNYMTSRLCFWCYILLLTWRFFDGYFLLCSSKSSFCGTIMNVLKEFKSFKALNDKIYLINNCFGGQRVWITC